MPLLRIPALAYSQGSVILYAFAFDGTRLSEFATISRVRRSEGVLLGYQRPAIRRHVAAIRSYLESDTPRLPNALVLAFDERVQFKPSRGRPAGNAPTGSVGRVGTLLVPVDAQEPDHLKPAWVVDGQQRMTALGEADRGASTDPFPVCCVGFRASSEEEQREQFILINAARPLSKSLVYELLPVTEGHLPPALEARRFPAYLLARLNSDEASPFKGRVRVPTNPDGYINDNAVLRMLEHSLSDGVLYAFRRDDGDDVEGMLRTLNAYWGAVANVFPQAWALPPKRSRLTHGAGLIAMGYAMDAIADDLHDPQRWTQEEFLPTLRTLAPHCRWTSGVWSFGLGQQRRWNEIQNLGADIHLLTYHFLKLLKPGPGESSASAAGHATVVPERIDQSLNHAPSVSQ